MLVLQLLHKTGIIDPLKLHSYKFAEDIFKKITIYLIKKITV